MIGGVSHEMPRKNDQSALPKISILRGTVHAQMIRCGRSNCRCTRGQLHGPYYYRFFREGDKLTKKYVKLSEVEAVRAACLARRLQERRIAETRRTARRREQSGHAQWRGLVSFLRRLERGQL